LPTKSQLYESGRNRCSPEGKGVFFSEQGEASGRLVGTQKKGSVVPRKSKLTALRSSFSERKGGNQYDPEKKEGGGGPERGKFSE